MSSRSSVTLALMDVGYDQVRAGKDGSMELTTITLAKLAGARLLTRIRGQAAVNPRPE